MKRTEAVTRIKNLLDSLENIATSKIKAEVILSELESLGMTPPSTKKIRKYNEFFSVLEETKEWDSE